MSSLTTLLLQIAVVLAVARATGWLFRRIHQPQVMGEMAGGILLGPSVLGALAPGASRVLFPPGSLSALDTLSTIGLVLFMFLVGTQLDLHELRGRRRSALFISQTSIVVPFILGALLAVSLLRALGRPGVPVLHFALFMGAAMSITAFPVLARILAEERLLGTRVGSVALACAAVDDVQAWCILAAVVWLVRSTGAGAPLWLTLAGLTLYVVVMWTIVRGALHRLERRRADRDSLTQGRLALILITLFASAWVTDRLGMHALFGAFLFGAIMPRDSGITGLLAKRLEDVTVVLFLPLFFASAGLRTSLGLLSGGSMWFMFGLVLLVAVAGKAGGAMLAARATGMPWREAAALGALLNTRGLMELVVLKIGLEIGAISGTVFTMMALMALVTTLMTVPLLRWIRPGGTGRAHP
jgi:Kef-type K+ transport system membrane component KefB